MPLHLKASDGRVLLITEPALLSRCAWSSRSIYRAALMLVIWYTVYVNLFIVTLFQVWWPRWRCRGPSSSDGTTCITSASTTVLRKGIRTCLSTSPRASGKISTLALSFIRLHIFVNLNTCFKWVVSCKWCLFSRWSSKSVKALTTLPYGITDAADNA